MPRKRVLKPNTVFDKEALTSFFKEHEIKDIHLTKIWRHFMRNPSSSFDDIVNLPKSAKRLLSENFVATTSKIAEISHSNDNRTTKLLIELQDGNMIESVVIRHSDTRSGGHTVLCVSSQVGCKMGCTFCATGTMGLLSNLTNGEILEQIVHARSQIDATIRNIVFMGMGEPLDNWDEVKLSIEGMHDRSRFNIAWNHITMSTVGVVSRMKQFTDTFPRVNLALSLHAPNQEVRLKIVPTSKAYTITKLINAIKYHICQTKNKIFIEYITIGNVNADSDCAHGLAKLFLNLDKELKNEFDDIDIANHVIINLIPYNPTDIGDEYKFESPTPEQMENFKNTIMSYNLFCTIRNSTTSGQDIDGACGQLALKGASCNNGDKNGTIDIEDIVSTKKKTGKINARKVGANAASAEDEKISVETKSKKKEAKLWDNKLVQVSISFVIMVVLMTFVLKMFGLDWSFVMK